VPAQQVNARWLTDGDRPEPTIGRQGVVPLHGRVTYSRKVNDERQRVRRRGCPGLRLASRLQPANGRGALLAAGPSENVGVRQQVAATVPPCWMPANDLWPQGRCGFGPSESGILDFPLF